MALSYLIDTSVLKRLGQPVVRAAVEPLTARGEVARPTICDLEVGYSARYGSEWDQLMGSLNVFTPVETAAAHVHRALQVQRLLAARSQRGRKIPDLLVAAAGEELNLTVLHYDGDFDLIAAVTGQRTQWVVPSGQAD
ncbi:MAG TPA: PIN domain nuclease [Acidimicrobiales bacterium]|nr:PIN domain nuclease [Acidimicrobiales bacterium]